jgi:periplasmic protein TonB
MTHIKLHSAPTAPRRTQTARQSTPALTLSGICAAVLLASCAAPKPPPVQMPEPPPEVVVVPAPEPAAPVPELVSQADNPRAYRQDGARHLYGKNSGRIFHGQLPPLMHAVGVLQVQLDGMGKVVRLNWMRAPSHAPDVVKEIERTVYAAAPFPAPVRMGSVTYTDVWLWDKSGNFQLDTLTEGQRRK